MITNKHIDRIVSVIVVAALVVCFLAIGYSGQLAQAAGDTGVTMEYESKLFDTSQIITIDIQMDEDDWDDMLTNATAEEYKSCDVVINGTTFKNVAIRPKGNTSLTSIASDPDNNRYSFKLEFDHYDEGQTCWGLDKLILNNNFADATNMKEAIVYDMFQYLGADASLYNYAKISVNGEYWGVYLALEAVEDSFLLRNYGTRSGQLYKPDSMNMASASDDDSEDTSVPGGGGDFAGGGNAPGGGGFPGNGGGNIPGGGEFSGNSDENVSDDGDFPGNGGGNAPGSRDFSSSDENFPQAPGGNFPGMSNDNSAADSESTSSGETGDSSRSTAGAGFPNMPDGNFPDAPGNNSAASSDSASSETISEGETESTSESADNGRDSSSDGNSPDFGNFESGDRAGNPDGGGAGGFGMSSGGADLSYSDDDLDSYSTIWDGAVTDSTDKDHERVVEALKNISEGNDLDEYLDVDNILRYMAVHSFVVNEDSFTGSMDHNYYLYEYDGKLNIIPWDYNLSFGGMGMNSGDATSVINDPIDTPFQGTEFFDSLLENEEYLEKYHEYYRQLVEEYVQGGEFEKTYERIRSQIDQLVETDPNAMYSYEEYETAAATLVQVINLRAESVEGQLNGTIPSTEAGQMADSSALIDGSDIDLSVMGTFGGGGFSQTAVGAFSENAQQESESSSESETAIEDQQTLAQISSNASAGSETSEAAPGFNPSNAAPDAGGETTTEVAESSTEKEDSAAEPSGRPSFPGVGGDFSSAGNFPGFNDSSQVQEDTTVQDNIRMYLILLGIVVAAAIIAWIYPKRKR